MKITKKIFFTAILLALFLYKMDAQQRITGGTQISIADAPWQVILKTNGSYSCGGSIIASNYVLTAKHCVSGLSENSVQIVAGITCKNEANSSNTFNVSEIILHPTLDVALLKLSSDISYNDSRQPINYLNSKNSIYYTIGNSALVSGWGW